MRAVSLRMAGEAATARGERTAARPHQRGNSCTRCVRKSQSKSDLKVRVLEKSQTKAMADLARPRTASSPYYSKGAWHDLRQSSPRRSPKREKSPVKPSSPGDGGLPVWRTSPISRRRRVLTEASVLGRRGCSGKRRVGRENSGSPPKGPPPILRAREDVIACRKNEDGDSAPRIVTVVRSSEENSSHVTIKGSSGGSEEEGRKAPPSGSSGSGGSGGRKGFAEMMGRNLTLLLSAGKRVLGRRDSSCQRTTSVDDPWGEKELRKMASDKRRKDSESDVNSGTSIDQGVGGRRRYAKSVDRRPSTQSPEQACPFSQCLCSGGVASLAEGAMTQEVTSTHVEPVPARIVETGDGRPLKLVARWTRLQSPSDIQDPVGRAAGDRAKTVRRSPLRRRRERSRVSGGSPRGRASRDCARRRTNSARPEENTVAAVPPDRLVLTRGSARHRPLPISDRERSSLSSKEDAWRHASLPASTMPADLVIVNKTNDIRLHGSICGVEERVVMDKHQDSITSYNRSKKSNSGAPWRPGVNTPSTLKGSNHDVRQISMRQCVDNIAAHTIGGSYNAIKNPTMQEKSHRNSMPTSSPTSYSTPVPTRIPRNMCTNVSSVCKDYLRVSLNGRETRDDFSQNDGNMKQPKNRFDQDGPTRKQDYLQIPEDQRETKDGFSEGERLVKPRSSKQQHVLVDRRETRDAFSQDEEPNYRQQYIKVPTNQRETKNACNQEDQPINKIMSPRIYHFRGQSLVRSSIQGRNRSIERTSIDQYSSQSACTNQTLTYPGSQRKSFTNLVSDQQKCLYSKTKLSVSQCPKISIQNLQSNDIFYENRDPEMVVSERPSSIKTVSSFSESMRKPSAMSLNSRSYAEVPVDNPQTRDAFNYTSQPAFRSNELRSFANAKNQQIRTDGMKEYTNSICPNTERIFLGVSQPKDSFEQTAPIVRQGRTVFERDRQTSVTSWSNRPLSNSSMEGCSVSGSISTPMAMMDHSRLTDGCPERSLPKRMLVDTWSQILGSENQGEYVQESQGSLESPVARERTEDVLQNTVGAEIPPSRSEATSATSHGSIILNDFEYEYDVKLNAVLPVGSGRAHENLGPGSMMPGSMIPGSKTCCACLAGSMMSGPRKPDTGVNAVTNVANQCLHSTVSVTVHQLNDTSNDDQRRVGVKVVRGGQVADHKSTVEQGSMTEEAQGQTFGRTVDQGTSMQYSSIPQWYPAGLSVMAHDFSNGTQILLPEPARTSFASGQSMLAQDCAGKRPKSMPEFLGGTLGHVNVQESGIKGQMFASDATRGSVGIGRSVTLRNPTVDRGVGMTSMYKEERSPGSGMVRELEGDGRFGMNVLHVDDMQPLHLIHSPTYRMVGMGYETLRSTVDYQGARFTQMGEIPKLASWNGQSIQDSLVDSSEFNGALMSDGVVQGVRRSRMQQQTRQGSPASNNRSETVVQEVNFTRLTGGGCLTPNGRSGILMYEQSICEAHDSPSDSVGVNKLIVPLLLDENVGLGTSGGSRSSKVPSQIERVVQRIGEGQRITTQSGSGQRIYKGQREAEIIIKMLSHDRDHEASHGRKRKPVSGKPKKKRGRSINSNDSPRGVNTTSYKINGYTTDKAVSSCTSKCSLPVAVASTVAVFNFSECDATFHQHMHSADEKLPKCSFSCDEGSDSEGEATMGCTST